MMVCRGAHASGAIMDHETNERIVVVAGGYYGGTSGTGTLDSTELLINGEWQQGMYDHAKKLLIAFFVQS